MWRFLKLWLQNIWKLLIKKSVQASIYVIAAPLPIRRSKLRWCLFKPMAGSRHCYWNMWCNWFRHIAWAFNQLLTGLSEVAIWSHCARRQYPDQFTPDYQNPFVNIFVKRYYASFGAYNMRVTKHISYLTTLWA